MDIREIEQLAELVQKAQIGELTLRQGEARLTLRKRPPAPPVGTALVLHEPDAWGEEAALLSEEAEAEIIEAESRPRTIWVTAPAVGYFRPMKPPLGLQAEVEAGQVVGAIETMNLMIEVTAPHDGVIIEVLAADGRPVEYGQRLFELEAPHA